MTILEEIKNCPVEWKELGEVALLKRGKTITSKTSTDGPYPVISGGQKPAYFHGEFNRKGETITVAGSGAYAGFVMYWDEPIFVSDAFSIEPLEDALIPKFLYHYLLEKQGILFSMKKGSGVAHVYPKDVSKILIPIPPLEIQEKIVQTLDKMTGYVTELTSELTSRNKQYSFYRDKLLSFEDEVYQVEWKELGEVVFTLTSPVKLAKKQYQLTGRIPIVDQGEQFIAGYTDNEKYLEKDEYIIFGDHSEHIKFVDFAFIQGADGLKILKPKKDINAKYLYYCVCNFYKKEGSYKRHWSNAKITLIPIPPLKIQEKVVQILDNFDKVCSDLNIGLPKEIELRQKQYEYWREQLLNFNK